MSSRLAFTDPALAAVAETRDRLREVEVAQLVAVLDWATDHQVGPALLRLGGYGCPTVSEYDVMDLACVLGRSQDGCTRYLGTALELRHRLPRLWQRVVALEVPVWKAFQIAQRTQALPPAGADDVDRHLAHAAHTIGPAQIDRTVATALAEHDPTRADDQRAAAEAGRFFDVGLDDTIPLTGVVEVHGLLDLADALDLEAAVAANATSLADLGSTESLDARRAAAVGEIARGQFALDLDTAGTPGGGRGVTIYAHTAAGTDVMTIDGVETTILADQLAAWCRAPGTKVTIKPVIDLASNISSDGYVPSPAVAEHVDLRDRGRCVFPYCRRRRTDRDHTQPWDDGGATESDNLGLLCRTHHRAKTFSTWTYIQERPGVYRWTSPAGATYLVDRTREP